MFRSFLYLDEDTVVHPVDHIKEVVELEWQRIEQQKIALSTANNPSSHETKEEVAV